MADLQADDYLALLDCLQAVAAACSLDEFRRRTIVALRRLILCDFIGQVEMRPDEGERALLKPLEAHLPEGEEILSRRVGTEYRIVFTFPVEKLRIVAIALSRKLRDFDERDRRLLELVRPHLVQARANAILFDQLRITVDHDGQAQIALSRDGEVKHMTRRAEEIGEGSAEISSPSLSTRESEVLQLVARGLTDAQIAEALVVSPRTIQKHLEHVYEKLGVRTRTAAVSRAFGLRGAAPNESGLAA